MKFLNLIKDRPRLTREKKRLRHAAILASKPDARFLVQLITQTATSGCEPQNKTAPQFGAAAYSSVKVGDVSARSSNNPNERTREF